MGPERKFEHKGYKVEEFYNKGKWIVYLNNKKVNKPYEEVVDNVMDIIGRKENWCDGIKRLKKKDAK